MPDGFDPATATIDLSTNQITVMPADDAFRDLTALTYLQLNTNQITISLPADAFRDLTKLNSLHLHINQITSLPADALRGLTALTLLRLDINQTTSLPADAFRGLTALLFLNLADNQITSVPANVFRDLTALTDLYLSGNQITSLPADAFRDLTALTKVDLNNNLITSLPAYAFQDLTALIYLYLDNNRIAAMPVQLVSPIATAAHNDILSMETSGGLLNCKLNYTDGTVSCDPTKCFAATSTTPHTHQQGPSGQRSLACEPFRLVPVPELPPQSACSRELMKLNHSIADLPDAFNINETIKIPAFTNCNKAELFDHVYENDTAKLSYAIRFTDEDGNPTDAPGGNSPVVNPDSGYIWIPPEPGAVNNTYRASLIAQDTSGHNVRIAGWNFTVKYNEEAGLKVDVSGLGRQHLMGSPSTFCETTVPSGQSGPRTASPR